MIICILRASSINTTIRLKLFVLAIQEHKVKAGVSFAVPQARLKHVCNQSTKHYKRLCLCVISVAVH